VKNRVISPFEGEINGVTIIDETIYRTVCYLLFKLEESFGECYNSKFVEDLADTVDIILMKYDAATMTDIENEFVASIESADSFEDLRFLMWDDDYKFDFLNKNRRNHIHR
jgi:hypothetical protein